MPFVTPPDLPPLNTVQEGVAQYGFPYVMGKREMHELAGHFRGIILRYNPLPTGKVKCEVYTTAARPTRSNPQGIKFAAFCTHIHPKVNRNVRSDLFRMRIFEDGSWSYRYIGASSSTNNGNYDVD